METAKISQLYDLGETIAAELFAGLTYPWEALPKISGFIKKLGPTLDPEVYEREYLGGEECDGCTDCFLKWTFNY